LRPRADKLWQIWLEIVEATNGYFGQYAAGFRLQVRNSGRSSAFSVRNENVSCDIGVITGDNLGPTFKAESHNPCAPQQSQDVITGATSDIGVPITCSRGPMRVQGTLQYREEARNRHEARWCFVWEHPQDPNSVIMPCTSYR
jgi:hypothetical protein